MTPPSPDLILFDLDGTLIDSLKDIHKCVNRLRETHDLAPVDRATVQGGIGHGARELVRATMPEKIDSEGTLDDRYAELLLVYESHAVSESQLYPGAERFLRRAAKHADLGILSNKPLGITGRILEHLQLTSLFRTVRCPENSRVRKPDPDAMHD
ncbi:MAG: HAD hydrolase-like protein, partial [Planctomycetota bacterium]